MKEGGCGPPARELLASCLATLFSVGDTFLLFDTINRCNDFLKTRDDSPAFLPCRLAATVVVGAMYEKLGRMMGRSYEETVTVLTKGLRNAESLTRVETMVTLAKVCKGLGGAAANVHKVSTSMSLASFPSSSSSSYFLSSSLIYFLYLSSSPSSYSSSSPLS